MVSLDVEQGDPYFAWERAKPPEIVIDIFDGKNRDELARRKSICARAGIPYRAEFSIYDQRSPAMLAVERWDEPEECYAPMERAWFPLLHLGLTVWKGRAERCPGRWLRWCGEDGAPIPPLMERLYPDEV